MGESPTTDFMYPKKVLKIMPSASTQLGGSPDTLNLMSENTFLQFTRQAGACMKILIIMMTSSRLENQQLTNSSETPESEFQSCVDIIDHRENVVEGPELINNQAAFVDDELCGSFLFVLNLRVTTWRPYDKKRRQGRPAKRWRDDLDKYWSDTIWQRTAQDRVIWRRHAEAFAQPRDTAAA